MGVPYNQTPKPFRGFSFLERRKMKKRLLVMALVLASAANMSFAEGEKKESNVLDNALKAVTFPISLLFENSTRLEPIIVTATRYKDPATKITSNITVINQEEISKSHSRYIPEILKSKAGIVVSDFLGNGKSSNVDMRGFGDSANQNVLVLIDGRRVNQIDLSGVDWTQLEVDSIDRIEIVRGSQTVMYGDNAVGGVINIITKNGSGKKPEIGYKQEFGSYRYTSYKGHIEGGSSFLDYYGSLSTSYNNGYRINNHLETVDYNGNLTIKPTDAARCKFSGAYHKDWYGLPSAVKPVDINRIGRRGSIAPDNRGKTEDFYFMATPEFENDFGFGEIYFSSDFLSRSRRSTSIYYSVWGDSENSYHIKTLGFTPKIAFTKEIHDFTNRIMLGFDYYQNRNEIDSGLLSSKDSLIIDKNTTGIYINDIVETPYRVNIDAGFRGEWAYYKFNQEAIVQGKNEKKPFEYAYQVGLNYKYNEKSSVYLKYDRAYRFPTTDQWYTQLYVDYFSGLIAGGLNLDLKPQVSHTYEVGIKESSFKYLDLHGAYYIMDVKNELYYNPITYANAVHHHTVHHGLELESTIFARDDFDIFGNYTFQKAFFVGENFAGNQIPMVPEHKFSLGFNYRLQDCFKLTYLCDYVGARRFANDLKNLQPYLKAYTVHNVKMTYQKYGFETFVALNNIFNEQYSEYGVLDTFTLSMPGYYPSPGRNFTAGFSYKF